MGSSVCRDGPCFSALEVSYIVLGLRRQVQGSLRLARRGLVERALNRRLFRSGAHLHRPGQSSYRIQHKPDIRSHVQVVRTSRMAFRPNGREPFDPCSCCFFFRVGPLVTYYAGEWKQYVSSRCLGRMTKTYCGC